ncbi:hypothetical protein SADUNF_Sadunf15G0053200 [Salix dunnii]|uniref:Uncharacterized protein n=1 Tax=Salix dunnii TaxID=1413687 RepID=A0A835JCN9_9ROSI|nr:hypothetical protein SADUNF_Sadunf15G0053200 [Salix dunnii]
MRKLTAHRFRSQILQCYFDSHKHRLGSLLLCHYKRRREKHNRCSYHKNNAGLFLGNDYNQEKFWQTDTVLASHGVEAQKIHNRLVRWFGLPSCSRSLPSLPTSTPESTPATECGDIVGSYTW